MSVTKIDDIKKLAGPREVELPGWEEDKPFVVILQRASLLGLASKGKIPNQLMSIAQAMFFQRVDPKKTSLKDISKVFDVIVEACLIEPSYKDVKDYLTDDQKYTIFQYSQQGLKALGKSSKANKS